MFIHDQLPWDSSELSDEFYWAMLVEQWHDDYGYRNFHFFYIAG